MNWMSVLLAALLLAGCSRAAMPDLEDVPPAAQASTNARSTTGEPGNAKLSSEASAGTVQGGLTPEQRLDVEHSIQRGLTNPNFASFGTMTARVSRFTSQSYIVCGWVKPDSKAEYEPFMVMYVPRMKTALLIGVGGRQPRATIHRQCVAEGIPLES